MNKWAEEYLPELVANKRRVKFRPKGGSMKPLIYSGDECTLVPVRPNTELNVGDIVLCQVRNNHYLHCIKAKVLECKTLLFTIGNNKGRINGRIEHSSIFGKLVDVEGRGTFKSLLFEKGREGVDGN